MLAVYKASTAFSFSNISSFLFIFILLGYLVVIVIFLLMLNKFEKQFCPALTFLCISIKNPLYKPLVVCTCFHKPPTVLLFLSHFYPLHTAFLHNTNNHLQEQNKSYNVMVKSSQVNYQWSGLKYGRTE